MPRSASDARPMSTTTPSSSSAAAPERRVDDEGRAVQPLRRTEHLAREAVRDHHVVADRDGVGHSASLQSIVWQRPGDDPSATAAMTAGRSRHDELAGEQGVERGIPQQPEREREPVAACCGCRAGAARPSRPGSSGSSAGGSGSRRRGRRLHGAVAEPARLDDLALGRGRRRARAAAPPRIRSRPPRGRARAARRPGCAYAHPEPLADRRPSSGRRRRAMTSTPGMPRASRATAQPIMPAPTTRDAIADEGRGIPQHVHRRLDRAGEHGPPGGDALGHDRDRRLGHDERRLVREQGEHRAALEARRRRCSTTPTLR